MNYIQKTAYRMKLRKELQKADWELLQLTKDELKKEFERRNKK